ncbi:hypothetical protein [uncultured Phascolarctobacterium sp.]|uniref:hypothetical protein n=1 Tax=uncultured Phascolarctobacterium sp. TaxID=512296 RepID=UPI0025FD0DC8|nr:hypothetical protein [uncultured Phascolarctobacterium sp.]
MLEMRQDSARSMFAKAFYRDEPKWLTWLFVIGVFTSFVGIGLVLLLIWGVIKLVFKFSGSFGIFDQYNACVQKDAEFLKDRAINVMGLIEEEFSLIDPIIASGYASDSSCIHVGEKIEKVSPTRVIWLWLMNKVCFWRKPEKISEHVFLDCGDGKVICSLVTFTYIAFTEQQAVAYKCYYDIAYGLILDEYTAEISYRDIDTVKYGDNLLHVWSVNKQNWSKAKISWLNLNVASNNAISASFYGENTVLNNQIPAVQALIRSKKEELA